MSMNLGLGLLVAVVVIVLLALKLRGASDADDTAPAGAALPYRVTGRFLSQAELAFFHAATGALAGQAVVCPKVELSHIFDVTSQAGRQAHYNRINRRHIDFLLCEPGSMQARAGVLLINPSHTNEKDDFIAQVFNVAGLTLLRVPARTAYSPQDMAQFIAALSGAAGQRREAAPGGKAPTCPKCGVELVVRTQRQGGNRFYGCPNYPACRHTAPID